MSADTEERRVDAAPSLYGVAAIDQALQTGVLDRLGHVVALTVLAQSGSSFFDGVVRFFSSAFDAEMVFIGLMEKGGVPTIRTLVAFRKCERVPNFTYEMAGTPCEGVVTPSMTCCFPSRVAERFPEDAALADMGIEGYCGTPLFDRSGTMLGLFAILTREPIEQPDALMALIAVYAERAALELEYLLLLERGEQGQDLHELMAAREDELTRAFSRLSEL